MREFSEQELVRRAKAEEIRAKGIDPFGSRFDVTTNSKLIIEEYGFCEKEELSTKANGEEPAETQENAKRRGHKKAAK